MLDDFTMAKAIAVAIGFGIILVNIEIGLGFASYHIKPLLLGGIITGGIIFGIGMGILGYCPGTLAVSLGEGSVDALIGLIGGLVGGVVYTIILPSVKWITGPDFGQLALKTIISGNTPVFYLLVLISGGILIGVAFWLNKIEKVKEFKWLYTGLGLAVLTSIIFLTSTTNRVLGASTFYPYFGDLITGTTDNNYFKDITASGHWEMIFLAGAFLSGLILSVIRKDFRFILIHDNWKKYKGDSSDQKNSMGFYRRVFNNYWCKTCRRMYKRSYNFGWYATCFEQLFVCHICVWSLSAYRKDIL